MHRRTLFLAAAIGLAGLTLVPPAFADEAANIDVVKAYLAAWNARDIDGAVAYLSEDVVYTDPSVGVPVNGKADANTKIVASFINAVPDLVWDVVGDPIAQGDTVVWQWRFSGTNSGAWADGTAAANKPFSFVGASVFTVKDGLITSETDYYDVLTFYKQLGWI